MPGALALGPIQRVVRARRRSVVREWRGVNLSFRAAGVAPSTGRFEAERSN
jgi:hypothetical protein